MASIDVYGYTGWKMRIESYHKIHVIFAIADRKKKPSLAWYLFSEDVPEKGQHLFDYVDTGTQKLDGNEPFGGPYPWPTPNPYDGKGIGRLAHRLPGKGAPAKLFMITSNKDATTTCEISHLTDLDGKLVRLKFDLLTLGDKGIDGILRALQELGITKGHVGLLGVEPFSPHALKRGIEGRSKLTNNVDPYDPVW
jgi:hypothetical protein